MTKRKLFFIAVGVILTGAVLTLLAPQRFADRYQSNARAHLDAYLEAQRARQPQIETIIQKGISTSPEEDKKLHELVQAEIKAAADLPNTNYNLPVQAFLNWHLAYREPKRIQHELRVLANEARELYQTTDLFNTYLEKRIVINNRVNENPLETAVHRQQIIDDYKSLVATGDSGIAQLLAVKDAVAAKRKVDKRYLELWSEYPAMYDNSDNAAIDSLNIQILANDQENERASELVTKVVETSDKKIKANHERITRLRDSIKTGV